MLAALVLASGVLSTVDVGAYSEFRLRLAPQLAADHVSQTLFTGLDFAALPYVRVESKSRHVDFKFAYVADVTVPDLESLASAPQAPTFFQMADMSVWYTSTHWLVGASQGGSIGQMNFSYLTPYSVTPGQPAGGPPPVQLIPCTDPSRCANETVTYGASATSVMLRYTHRETSYSISPSYSVAGGLDTPSRALVPLISIPRIDFGLEYHASRRDDLLTQADLTFAESSQRACNPQTGGPPIDLIDPNPPLCAPSEQWVSLKEVWRHRFARRVNMELTAGATLARWTVNETDDPAHNNPAQSYRVVPYPVGAAVLSYTLQNPDPDRPLLHPTLTDPPRPSAYLYARMGPVIDTHYGIVDQRFETGAAVLKPLDEKYTIHGRLGVVRSLWDSELDATYIAGEGAVYRRLDKYRFDIGTGLRAAWQHDAFSGEFWVFNVYLSLLWHEPRFVL